MVVAQGRVARFDGGRFKHITAPLSLFCHGRDRGAGVEIPLSGLFLCPGKGFAPFWFFFFYFLVVVYLEPKSLKCQDLKSNPKSLVFVNAPDSANLAWAKI